MDAKSVGGSFGGESGSAPSFTWIQMWTLTVDPKHFRTPEACYRYVMGKRLLARLVRELRDTGYLNSRWSYWVFETHQSGWPHWHLVLDTSYLPHHLVQAIWDRLGAKGGNFGWVQFSKGKGGKLGGFGNAYHAACYVTKYITKQPKNGWPAWVMGYVGRIKRFHAAHGMWAALGQEPKPKKEAAESVTRGKYRLKNTVSDRIRECGSDIAVYKKSRQGVELMGVVPLEAKRFAEFFGVEDRDRWTIPEPGANRYVDLLIWGWCSGTRGPRCLLDKKGRLDWVHQWKPELLDNAEPAFFAEVC